jgi:acyl-CoA synthetase (AMP-forming)/AMP-acid ligase II
LVDAATGLTLTGDELPGLIVGFAVGFLSAGLRPGDRLLVGCAQSPASTLAYLGAMYAGIVPVPVEERLLSMSGDPLIAKSRARAIWMAKARKGDSSKKTAVWHIEGGFEICSPDVLPPSGCVENDLAALMPTSGSTGVPRLVMVSHGNLRSNTEAIIRSQRLGQGDTAMLVMPVSYCFGASVVHTHLYQGGGVVFDSRFMFADKVLHAVNAYNCATFAGVPFIYYALLRRSNLRSITLPGLRRFLQAGGALAPESVRELCSIVPTAEFFAMYGQTEATARISCLPAARLSDKMGSAGLPLDNLEVRIADDEGRVLPMGQVGEIQVRGPSVCSGYFDEPEWTERKFGSGWLKTGDSASCDDEGYLWVKGRTEEFVKIRGLRVSVAEVESRVGTISGITECAAIGVKHPEQGEGLALLIVAEDSGDSLTERIWRALPPHWTGATLKFVAELPRSANGKIARHQLATLL